MAHFTNSTPQHNRICGSQNPPPDNLVERDNVAGQAGSRPLPESWEKRDERLGKRRRGGPSAAGRQLADAHRNGPRGAADRLDASHGGGVDPVSFRSPSRDPAASGDRSYARGDRVGAARQRGAAGEDPVATTHFAAE